MGSDLSNGPSATLSFPHHLWHRSGRRKDHHLFPLSYMESLGMIGDSRRLDSSFHVPLGKPLIPRLPTDQCVGG